MASVDAAAVKKLREMTSAGIMDCKSALAEANGDFDKAATLLREKGIASAAKKAERTAADGSIGIYVHNDGKQAALVEINCETDFVAKTEDFQQLCRDLAMQVVAMKPLYLRREDVPAEVLEAERRIYEQQAAQEGKPEAIQSKIAEGRLNKEFYQAVCLMEQAFIKENKKTIDQLVKEAIGKLGENIQVARFTRYKVGER
ncbi:MAG: translation elongation factor Ts [Abitibacteriaceae bacterium]|nr:translation elongation factor Ts [Abditibacteriaceae bacterium]